MRFYPILTLVAVASMGFAVIATVVAFVTLFAWGATPWFPWCLGAALLFSAPAAAIAAIDDGSCRCCQRCCQRRGG